MPIEQYNDRYMNKRSSSKIMRLKNDDINKKYDFNKQSNAKNKQVFIILNVNM